MKTWLYILVFGLNASLALGQQDSLKNKKIYSISLVAQAGYAYALNNFPSTYFNKMVQGTILDNQGLKLLGYVGNMQTTEFTLMLGWKIKKFKYNKLISFCEAGTGAGYYFANGLTGYYNNDINSSPQSTGRFSFSGVRILSNVSLHSRPILKQFAVRAGFNLGYSYLLLGHRYDTDAFISDVSHYPHTSIYNSKNSCASFSLPLGIKYNASCELNIELFYNPELLFFTSDILKPTRYAQIQQFGVQLRYKLDTSPANTKIKRIDMFF